MPNKIIVKPARLLFAASLLLSVSACSEKSPDDALIERGEYLVNGIAACGNCHSARTPDGDLIEGKEFAGNFVIDDPGFIAYAPNITPDVRTGIGGWSTEEIIRAIREGVRPDGQILGPPMAFSLYRQISDSDIRAIVAYIESVPAVENEVPRTTFRIPLPPSWGPPLDHVPDVPRDDPVAYGAYLLGPLGHCTECHTPLVQGQFDWSRLGAGGNVFHNPLGKNFSAISSNITQHPELGLGEWTDDEIRRAIRDGIRPDGERLLPFMGFSFYKNISDEDLDAMVAYMRTIPPSEPPPPPAD